jgi:hypothetical protein
LIVSTNSDWTVAGDRKFNSELGNVSQYIDTGYPDDGTTYYWWVWAGNDGGWCDNAEAEANSRSFSNGEVILPPSAPTLISPADGTTIYSDTVTYQWNPASGATKYRLIVSTNPDWNIVVDRKFSSELGNVSQYIDTGYPEDGTTFHWWVWAGNNGGWCDNAEVEANSRSFINDLLPPSAPTLVSPGDGATVYGNSVTYQWNPSAGATKYWLIASINPDWRVKGERKYNSELGDVSQYIDTGYPDDGTDYYWWVWAGNNGGWCDNTEAEANSRSLTNGLLPPSAPTLVSPSDGATVYGNSVTYQWSPSADATNYRLIVSTNSDWTVAGDRKFSSELGDVNQYIDTGYPDDGTTYYWWVWAGNAAGWCDDTEAEANRRSLINGEAPSIPSAPTLLSPADGATVYGDTVTYQWSPSADATKYWLIVSTNSDWRVKGERKFNSELGNVSQYVDTGYPEDDTTYHWWVWAGNNAGWCDNAEAEANSRSYTSGMLQPSAPTLISPDDGAEVPGDTVTYQWNPSSGATKYWLIVSTNPDWRVKGERKFNSELGDVSQYIDTGYPDDGTIYYWWVWAGNAAGWCDNTEAEANSRSITNFLLPPSAPTLVSPGDGATVPGNSVTYQWNPPAAATKYWLIVSTNADWRVRGERKFNSELGDVSQYIDTGYPDDGTTYYWWVWAGNAAGWCDNTEAEANRRSFSNG